MHALALVALAAACVLGRSDVRRGRLETLARQPRDVEVDVDAGILAYASNEKRLKQKRRIARTLGGARAHAYAGRPFAFVVEFASGQSLTWVARSAADRDEWVRAITAAANRPGVSTTVKPLAPRGTCPKVYVYDLPALWDYDATPLAAFADEPYDKFSGATATWASPTSTGRINSTRASSSSGGYFEIKGARRGRGDRRTRTSSSRRRGRRAATRATGAATAVGSPTSTAICGTSTIGRRTATYYSWARGT